MSNNELQHFGIKGMRWGIRRAKPTANNKPSVAPGSVKDEYLERKKQIRRTVIAGRGASIAGKLLVRLSKKSNNNSTIAAGMNYTGKLLKKIGTVTLVGGAAASVYNFEAYRRDSRKTVNVN